MIPVAEPRTAEEVIANAKAARARLNGKPGTTPVVLPEIALAAKRRGEQEAREEEARRQAELKAAREERERLQREADKEALRRGMEESLAKTREGADIETLGLQEAREARLFRISPRRYLEQLCGEQGFSVWAIIGRSHRANIVRARHAMILSVARKFPNLSLVQLGMLFERDHTTIIHALRRAKQAEAIAASREPCEAVIDFNELRAVAADHRSFGGLP